MRGRGVVPAKGSSCTQSGMTSFLSICEGLGFSDS